MPAKPRHRSGYRPEETELVESACLTLAVTLGAFMDQLRIVGGFAPSLLIDHQIGPDPQTGDTHSGTNDLDVGLAVALLDNHQYTAISNRLRQEGFAPDVNERGNRTPQRWRLGDLNATVDFLLPPLPGAAAGGRVQALEGDFGALIAPGLELAFDERRDVVVNGHTLHGEAVTRTVPVCGPAAFVILKALALADRGENKDAYDLVYVLRRWPHGIDDIAERLTNHTRHHPEIVQLGLAKLATDFASPDSIGPRRAVEFEAIGDIDLDSATADAHGYVDDLLRACRQHGLHIP